MNEGDMMVVTIFLIVSIFIVLMFILNKLRITRFPISFFFQCIKWYVSALMIYYILASNQFYLRDITREVQDSLNLAILTIISFGMIIYIHEYSQEKLRQQKLHELTVACALMDHEMKQNQNQHNSKKDI